MSKRRQTNAVTALAGISLTENEPENIDNKEVERLRRENARLKIASENADGSQLIGELEQKLETAIVRIDDNTLGFQRVRLHRSYADLPSDISENEVEQLGFALVDLGQNINFWLGDVVLWYFDKYNAESDKEKSDIYTWLAEKFDKSHSVLKNAVWVAGNVPASTRVDAPLSFTHYRIIVGATDNEDDVKMWAKIGRAHV